MTSHEHHLYEIKYSGRTFLCSLSGNMLEPKIFAWLTSAQVVGYCQPETTVDGCEDWTDLPGGRSMEVCDLRYGDITEILGET